MYIAHIKHLSHKGTQVNNGDSYLLDLEIQTGEEKEIVLKDFSPDPVMYHIVAVSDGVSRSDSDKGKAASLECMELLRKKVQQIGSNIDLVKWTENAFHFVHESMVEKNQNRIQGSYCTLSLCIWNGKTGEIVCANIGDSPIFLIRNNDCKVCYQKQNQAGLSESAGKKASLGEERRLINYIGRRGIQAVQMIHMMQGHLRDKDRIIVATDGIFDADPKFTASAVLNSFPKKLLPKIKKGISKRGRYIDNITMVTVDFETNLGTTVLERGFREADDFVSQLEDYRDDLMNFREIIARYRNNADNINLKQVDLMYLTGFTKSKLQRLMNKPSKKRNEMIILGLALNMSYEELDTYLSKYCQLHRLYPNNKTDLIWIYILSHHPRDIHGRSIPALFDDYANEYELIKGNYEPQIKEDHGILDVERIQTAKSFQELVENNLDSIKEGYENLKTYLNSEESKGIFLNVNQLFPYSMSDPFNANINRDYYRNITTKVNQDIVPNRTDLLAYAIECGADLNAINQLLSWAQMAPLYARDPVEALIIYLLEHGAADHLKEEMLAFYEDEENEEIIEEFFPLHTGLFEKLKGSPFYA